MKKVYLMLILLMAVGSVMAGTVTKSTTPPTDVFASGAVDSPSFTRVFDVDVNTNHARGNEIKSDDGQSYAGYTMTALALRKKTAQDFTGTTAFLTLLVFEGTATDYALGDGDGDGDIWDETGITTVYTETFALDGSYADLDYVTFNLDTPIIMAENMSFLVLYEQGDSSANGYFQIGQLSNTGWVVDGRSYQLKPTSQDSYPSPQEYYAVGVNNNVASNVYPTGDAVDPATVTTIEWDPPLGYVPTGYDLVYRKATEDNEPNFAALTGNVSPAIIGTSAAVTLDYSSTYYCKVTAYEPNDVSPFVAIPHDYIWSFTTMLADTLPVVTLSSHVIWLDLLPFNVESAVVEDNGEGDIDSVTWEVIAGPGIPVAADMRVINHNSGLFNIIANQSLLRDSIGTDCEGVNEANSDVMTLTLSGVPAGEYSWTSYHYELGNESTQVIASVFDVTVTDSTSSTTTQDVPVYSGLIQDPGSASFTTTITSDGSDVTLQFVGSDDGLGLFVMNGLKLTRIVDSNSLNVDFGTGSSPVEAGYQAYQATNAAPETFTAQDFAAFDTTVTVTPDWNAVGMEIISTGGTVLAPTATVDTTDAPKVFGPYTIRVKATENTNDGQTPQTGSATMQIQLAADTCAAAQLVPGFEFDASDIDQNCVVDLLDFAVLAGQWLNDLALTKPATY